MKAIKVPFKEAEKVKIFLQKNNLFNHDFKISKGAGFIYFPILKEKKIPKALDYELVSRDMEKSEKLSNFYDLLTKILSKADIKKLPQSYDVVGDIAILEIPDILLKQEKNIAKALMQSNKNIKTVLRKADIHAGEFRTQKLKYLCGKKTKETIHKENNVKIKLNVEKVYFSIRSSNERKRIASLVKPNESVLVMFSGCAPFPLVISKNSKAKEIYSIELNPIAHKYAKENIKLNKINNIYPIKGDVRKVKLNKLFDRIVMPLPKTAEEFLPFALKYSKKGTFIHLYLFQSDDQIKDAKKRIYDACNKNGKKCDVVDVVKCGSFSPGFFRMCFDILIL